MSKTIRQFLEAAMPKTTDEMEVVECVEEAMDQYPELGDEKMTMKKDQMEEGYGEDDGDGDGKQDDSDPSEGIKIAFKKAMMKVLDDDSLDTVGKLQKLKIILAVSDKAMEAMGNGQPDSGMDSEGMNMGQMEESYRKKISGLQDELDRTKCRSMLIESGVEITDVRVKALKALQESERQDLVKTWKPGNVATGKRPERTGSVMHESASGAYPADFKEFSRMLG
jgi:hypothetical protein